MRWVRWRRGLWWGWWCGLVLASVVQAQTCVSGGEGFVPVDYQEFTVGPTTPVSIDLTKLPASATNLGMAYISVEDATIRFRFGGGTPSSTSGHEIAAGTNSIICGRAVVESFRAIRTSQGSTNAIMRVTLFQSK